MKDILVETLDILNDGGVEKVKMCCAYHVTELHIWLKSEMMLAI